VTPLRACVIGAGPGGVAAAKVLIEDGFDVTVFDRYLEVGGIWGAGRCYTGLHNQSVRGVFEYADLPNRLHMAGAAETRRYIEEYAARFGVLERTRFSTDVVSVRSDGPGWAITTRPVSGTGGDSDHAFEYVVVASGAHHHPYIPDLPDRDCFEGTVLHANEVVDPAALEGRRVIVVGGGKSALDLSLLAARHGTAATSVQRRVNWFVPERIVFGRLTYDRILLTRLGEAFLPTYHAASVVRPLDRMPAGVKRAVWRMIGWDLLRSGGLDRLPEHVRPRGELPVALAHTGVMPAEWAPAVADGRIEVKVAALAGYSPKGLVLAGGNEVQGDVIVFATGHRKVFPFLDPGITIHDGAGRLRLYQGIAVPGVPHLGFIGLRQIFNNVLGMEISAHWLSSYFQHALRPMPGREQMELAIDSRLAWQERVLPGSMGYDFAAYDIHCVDELMQEMGLTPYRTGNPVSEWLLPAAVGRRYANLSPERREAINSVRKKAAGGEA
jgi:cation diffusion facilitator CzcD-associated flavoprotein CzcO